MLFILDTNEHPGDVICFIVDVACVIAIYISIFASDFWRQLKLFVELEFIDGVNAN